MGTKTLPFARSIAFAIIEQLEKEGCFKNCLNCHNWAVVFDKCALFNEKPPTKVIVDGCEHHIFTDDIPF